MLRLGISHLREVDITIITKSNYMRMDLGNKRVNCHIVDLGNTALSVFDI